MHNEGRALPVRPFLLSGERLPISIGQSNPEGGNVKSSAFGMSLIVALFLCAPAAAQEITSAEVDHPNQRVTVSNLAVVKAADASSPAVAKAAFAIVLSGLKVKCDAASQLEGVLEGATGPSLHALASRISGASCATNGQTRRVTATFTPNGAIQADNVIAPLVEGKPLLVEWKNALYVLYGVVYDEHLFSNGSRTNVIRELLLIDPRYSDQRRLAAFERDKDNFAEVEGIASVAVGQ